MRLQSVSRIGNKVSDETVFKKKGYKFLHSRKKKILKPNDLKERLKFSRKIKRIFKKISGQKEYHSIWME